MTSTPIDPGLPQADLALIKRIIPHRYPFLFIDKVINIVAGESAVGIKNVTVNEPFFEGHFPAKPIMPGVLVVEAMAQAASVLVGVTHDLVDKEMLVYFMGLEKTRFRRMVVPGDRLELHVRQTRGGGKVFKFEGRATVDGELAAEAEFMAMMQQGQGG